ncbi:anti-sigma factor domain-containing protein [Streptomyces sp. NPDC057486]|uniref:anti-sigma factor n=1 Tax=Streptomyces sp. NPDC057486 TaxID=3346145 RepID=UPI00367C8AAC
MRGAELHTLTGAHALYALPDAERGEFERHLGDCEACAVEVRELSETAPRLGLAASAAPPRELRDRVLREITTVWQNQVARDAQEEAHLSRQGSEQVAQVLAAPDAKATSGALKGGAKGTVVVSRSENRAVFVASGMEPPSRGKLYQLWFDDHGTMRSAGLINRAATSNTVLLDGPVDGASGIGITVEPAGGSVQPTSAPLALLTFPTV